MKTVVVVNSESMGRGDDPLGRKILQTFLNKAQAAFRQLDAIVFYNAGVKLLIEGSPLLQSLAVIDERGADLVACGTCVDYFGVREQIKIGEVSNMDHILSVLERADKVITL